MAERLSYHSRGVLSPYLTQILVKGNVNPGVAAQIQNETNAYFHFEEGIFGGVIHHPPCLGPEIPYFRPEENTDWIPEVQAIGRIESNMIIGICSIKDWPKKILTQAECLR